MKGGRLVDNGNFKIDMSHNYNGLNVLLYGH